MTEVLIGFLVVFGLLLLGAPIAFGMALVGFGGFAVIVNWNAALAMLGQIAYETTMSDALSVVPLFILMGNLITRAGLSRQLFEFAYAFLGHFRGGLAMATVVACGGFAAVSGSSMATSATMAKVAIPQMRRFGYSDALGAGSIAAGGTLGILIPPSVILVLYGTLTSTDIGTLFVAGIIPGLIGVLFYIGAVQGLALVDPAAAPRGERSDWGQRLRATGRIWGVALLFGLVMGGIYFGIFTPTEAAGIGAGGAFVFALLRGGLTLRRLYEVLVETALTSCMMFVLLIGAILFSNFINVAGLPRELSALIAGTEAPPLVILLVILLIYVALGCVLESLSMMMLTVPIFFPIVQGLGFDPVWFGIVVVIVIEISLITPPIGMNAFVLRATLPEIPIQTIFRGLAPFILADVLRLALLVLVPWFTLILPALM